MKGHNYNLNPKIFRNTFISKISCQTYDTYQRIKLQKKKLKRKTITKEKKMNYSRTL